MGPEQKQNKRVDDKYTAAIHEAGRLVAADAVILDMEKRGVGPSPPGRNATKEEFYRASIVVALAGTVAEYNLLSLHDADHKRRVLKIDERDVVCDLLELLPTKETFLRKMITSVLSVGDYWSDFWALLFTLTTSTETNRQAALEEVNEYTDADENADLAEVNARLFELLWPLALQARDIIDYQWESVEKVASDLLKAESVEDTQAGPFLVR